MDEHLARGEASHRQVETNCFNSQRPPELLAIGQCKKHALYMLINSQPIVLSKRGLLKSIYVNQRCRVLSGSFGIIGRGKRPPEDFS